MLVGCADLTHPTRLVDWRSGVNVYIKTHRLGRPSPDSLPEDGAMVPEGPAAERESEVTTKVTKSTQVGGETSGRLLRVGGQQKSVMSGG
jgi:hypothetical protein